MQRGLKGMCDFLEERGAGPLFPEKNVGKCCQKRKKGCFREKMVGRDLEVGGIA